MRRAPLVASVLLAVALAGCGGSSTPRGDSPVQKTPVPAATSASATTPTSPDPNDPALVLSVDNPCEAPCVREGITYAKRASALNPGAGEQQLKLDLFRSAKTPKRRAPVVVVIHGGGFVSGDRSQMRWIAEALADDAYLVASISYRLADPARNPGTGLVKNAELETASAEAEADAETAIAYLRDHAAELGATDQPARYAVGGYSAGAITALRVAVRGGDASTPAARRVRIGGAFSISGSECSGPFLARLGCTPAYDKADAPLLLFHGEQDSVIAVDGARATCADAITEGGGCTAYFYPGQDHFWSSGTILGGGQELTAKSPAVTPTIALWLARVLKT